MKNLNKTTSYGSIDISKDAIAKIVGDEICSSYGVAGLVDKNLANNKMEILPSEKYRKAIKTLLFLFYCNNLTCPWHNQAY